MFSWICGFGFSPERLCAPHTGRPVWICGSEARGSPFAGRGGWLGSPKTRFIKKIDKDSNRACFRNLPSHSAWLCFSSVVEARAGGGQSPAGYTGDTSEGKRKAKRLLGGMSALAGSPARV